MFRADQNNPAQGDRRAETAFSLVELLAAIAIVALLAGLLLPTLGRAKETGRGAACLNNLHQIGLALQLYVDDNDGKMPAMRDKLFGTNPPAPGDAKSMDLVLSNHLGNAAVLRCPSDAKVFPETASSYSWNSLLNGQDSAHLKVFTLEFDAHQIPVSFDKEAFHKARGAGKGVNYLYADGHIRNLLVMEGILKK